MKISYLLRVALWGFTALVVMAIAAAPTHAQVITTNGGFEAGFTGWTRADQLGSAGTFALQSGASSPVNGNPVPMPPGGVQAAMTDAQGPGSHVLFDIAHILLDGCELGFSSEAEAVNSKGATRTHG